MNRYAIVAVTLGIIALALLAYVLGIYLLPTSEAAQERGTYAPWLITWAMIWGTILTSLVLAGFLLVSGARPTA